MLSLRQGLDLDGKGVISIVGAGGKTSLMFRLAKELAASGDTVLTTTTTKILRPTAEQSPHLIISGTPAEILKRARDVLQYSPHISAASEVLPPHDKLIGFPPENIALFHGANLFRWIIVEADGAAGRPLKAPATHEPVIPACTQLVIGLVGLSVLGKPLDEQNAFRSELVSKISGLSKGAPIENDTLCAVLTHRQGIFKGTPPTAIKIAFLNQADIPGKYHSARSIVQILKGHKDIGIARVVIGSALMKPAILEYHDL